MRVFKEEQGFKQLWVIGLVTISVIISIIMITQRYIKEEVSITKYLMMIFVFLMSGVLVFRFKLETRIDERGVHYKFFPFHLKYRTKAWSEIEAIYVRKYEPILEYGGWGLKGVALWNKKKGNAYNVSGNIGVQLILKNKKKILIGTQKESEVVNTINYYLKK